MARFLLANRTVVFGGAEEALEAGSRAGSALALLREAEADLGPEASARFRAAAAELCRP